MYWDDHLPPHFHAEYAETSALIDIRNSVVVRGMLPFKQLKLVLAWCELHEKELLKNWEAAQRHEDLAVIEPLA